MNNYAWILFENQKSPSDVTEAKTYFELAANKGNMTAMRNYLKCQLFDNLLIKSFMLKTLIKMYFNAQ